MLLTWQHCVVLYAECELKYFMANEKKTCKVFLFTFLKSYVVTYEYILVVRTYSTVIYYGIHISRYLAHLHDRHDILPMRTHVLAHGRVCEWSSLTSPLFISFHFMLASQNQFFLSHSLKFKRFCFAYIHPFVLNGQ